MTQASASIPVSSARTSAYTPVRLAGLILGPLLFALLVILPAPEGMPPEAKIVAATTLWIAIWWMTEAIPIPATSLLPLIVLPLMGVMKPSELAPGYANPLIFVFIGGFMIALALERWNLHRRIALRIVSLVGVSPTRIVLGFMLATGFLSMWISNTATAMMMMPVMAALAVAVNVHPLLLMAPAAIAASCAFMLPVATPPNAIVFGSGSVTVPQMARAGL